MTDAEKIAAWDRLSALADAQQPSAEEVVEAVMAKVPPGLTPTDALRLLLNGVAAAIRQRDQIAARAAVLAELRERALREELEWAAGNCAWCGCFGHCSADASRCECGGTQALLAAKAALAAPSGPGVLAQVVEALREALPLAADASANLNPPTSVVHSHVVEALRALGEDVP